MDMTWAERITGLEARGMTLTEIGKQIGLSKSALCEIKGGQSKEPRGMAAVRLYKLAERKLRNGR